MVASMIEKNDIVSIQGVSDVVTDVQSRMLRIVLKFKEAPTAILSPDEYVEVKGRLVSTFKVPE